MNRPPDNDEPFLSRWSRRKRAVTKGEALPPGESADSALAPGADSALAPGADSARSQSAATAVDGAGQGEAGVEVAEGREEFDLSTLPRVDELDEHSDIKAFLDKRVPAALRNAALGRMWTLDPTIRDFIEVAENQWNWNVPGGAPFYEPLEGGLEMAEEILSGFGSAAKAVTDAVVPGESHSTLVDGEGGARAAADTDVPIKDVVVADAAAQTEPQLITLRSDTPTPVSIRNSDAKLEDAAAQHVELAGVAQDTPRRRHGGALPG